MMVGCILALCCGALKVVRGMLRCGLSPHSFRVAFAPESACSELEKCRGMKVFSGGNILAHAQEEVSRLTDAELVFRLERLVQADRALSAKLLVHLGELDERRLFLVRGYSSTFDYCRKALRMSEAEAYLRIQAARVGRRFPLVVERAS